MVPVGLTTMPAVLPDLYAKWLAELLPGQIPAETLATCDDCAMCAKPAVVSPGRLFDERVKCCTYFPILPNFLLGGVLRDLESAAEGRNRVVRLIQQGVGVTPLGLARPEAYAAVYGSLLRDAFGRDVTLKCPFYVDDGGTCGIWRHRNGVCSTWFCKFVRGAVGLRFWQDLQEFLTEIENRLAEWCVLQLGVETTCLQVLFPPHDSGEKPELGERERRGTVVWGRWQGQEVEFYEKCAALAGELSWEAVEKISGPRLQIRKQLVLSAFRDLGESALPRTLTPGRITIIQQGSEACDVVSYRGFDPRTISRSVLELLPSFDGRRTTAVLRSIEEESGVRLEDELVRRLVDLRILVENESGFSAHGKG